MLWLPRYLWLLIAPLALFAALGVKLDVRFLIIAIVYIFVILPMGLPFFYYYYMLAPEARRAILPKRVEVNEGQWLKLIYEPHEHLRTPPDELIPWTQIRTVRRTSTSLIYILRTPRFQFITIPFTAIKKEYGCCSSLVPSSRSGGR